LPQLIEKVQNGAVAFEFPRNLRSVNGKALLSLPHICSNRNIHEREWDYLPTVNSTHNSVCGVARAIKSKSSVLTSVFFFAERKNALIKTNCKAGRPIFCTF
jgi:hypothetical protein